MNGTRYGDFSLPYGLGGDRSRVPSRLSFRRDCNTGGSRSRVYPIGECVAAFDNDGTLRPKNPLAFQLAFLIGGPLLYAVACRWARRGDTWLLESWTHALTLGQPLPTLPLWLAENLAVPLELERSYEETCRILRLPWPGQLAETESRRRPRDLDPDGLG
jgi:hypothetical protein